MLDRTRKDLVTSKEECHAAVQEGLAYKQQMHKLELELHGAREQEKMLSDQVWPWQDIEAGRLFFIHLIVVLDW